MNELALMEDECIIAEIIYVVVREKKSCLIVNSKSSFSLHLFFRFGSFYRGAGYKLQLPAQQKLLEG
jgi:hypothetical protein